MNAQLVRTMKSHRDLKRADLLEELALQNRLGGEAALT